MKQSIKLILILTFANFASVFFVSKGKTQSKTETAGQKFKSIKVLNDMPADQMGKVMNMMSASLGVNCKFCHASNDGDYEKEGFEHKDIARQMLKMTFDLNKTYFEGRPEITCATCHQGKPMPQSAVPLVPLVREPRRVKTENMPSVEEILAKYEMALGGKANLTKIVSRQIKAQRIEPDGKTFEAEEILQKGSKMLVKTIYPSKQYGDYLVTEGFDGKAAWKSGTSKKSVVKTDEARQTTGLFITSETTVIALKSDEAEQIKREAQLFVNPDLKAIYPKMEAVSIERIEGNEVYVISATTAENQVEKLYFNLQTGLLVSRVASTPTILGSFVYQVDYKSYKNFGGVKLPTFIKFAVPSISWTRRVLEVRNNVTIEDTTFIK